MASPNPSLAILDDYASIAPPIFNHLSSRISIASFPKTLRASDPEQKKALIQRLHPFTVISTMRERTALPADVIAALPNLKLVLTTGMKNAAIDLAACTEHGVVVAGAKGTGKAGGSPPTSLDSTLQHTWALILGLARNIAWDDAAVKSGGWEGSFSTGLKGKTLALLGLGKLGGDTAKVGVLAFGMKVLAWSSNLTQEAADAKAELFGLPAGSFEVAKSKNELFERADVLSLHYVLSERSRHIVGAAELALLKPAALLVNTSRAPLVDEQALLSILKKGSIQGAAFDVFVVEPLPLDSEWRTTKWGEGGTSKVLLSPHQGYVEQGSMKRWYEDTASSLEKWLDGEELSTRMN